jgi:hypothetical protein
MTPKEQFEALARQLTTEWASSKKPIKAQFPTGYIRRFQDVSHRWPYLEPDRARTVCCVIQLCDINRWNLNIWKIELTAGTIWEWHSTLPVIAVIETICREFALQRKWIKEDTKFQKALNVLHSKGILREPLWKALDKLREYRNTIHLYLHKKIEMHDGLPKRYNAAVRLLHQLEKRLSEYHAMETGQTKGSDSLSTVSLTRASAAPEKLGRS